MRSIIDEIASAEQQADELRASAAAESRERIAKAAQEGEQALAALNAREREAGIAALAAAERDGEELTETLKRQYDAEAESLCAVAVNRVEEAVTYLIKKVQEIA